MRLYRIICAALTWLCVLGQYVLLVRSGEFGGLVNSTLTYLGYFTVLTNILVGLAFIAPVLKAENKLRQFFSRQAVRAAIALYILVVMVVYWTLLASIHHPQGLSVLTNIGLHLIVPILYIFDWLVFAPKRNMKFRALPFWVLYPLAYGGFNIARGLMTGFYPYPFINLDQLGGAQVTLNMLGFTSLYLFGGAAFIALGRVLPDIKPATP